MLKTGTVKQRGGKLRGGAKIAAEIKKAVTLVML
jgi:hypothetical protein